MRPLLRAGRGSGSALLSLLMAFCAPAVAAEEPAVIPNPASITRAAGEFALGRATAIVAVDGDAEARSAAVTLAEIFRDTRGLRWSVAAGEARDGEINLRRDASSALGAEGYRLEVTPRRVTVTAATRAGLFYGGITLWQLIDFAQPRAGVTIPALAIDDAPRFAWRGLLLDSARHYQSPEFILHFLDAMAAHKLNVLHWHLTDDQAWRLEIRKYPRLASVGAWRVPAGAARREIDPATGRARLYGGYYSQQTVRRIVAYAESRAITIVPEIEMPGHASAAIAAYPRLSATATGIREVPSDWGIYDNVYSLEDGTFAFLEDVLAETLALFPGAYVHIGGDEVVKTQWLESARARALMLSLGSDDPERLQAYFTQRIGRFLESRGRRAVGWDEVLAPGLPRSAVVMSWRGIDGALKAAADGYDTVLSPWPTLYFDNRQSSWPVEPPGRARVITVEDVYRFEPMPEALAADKRHHVLGVQGNIWTEHIRTEDRVEWMAFPRAAAVAELGWSQPGRRDWTDFRRRLATRSWHEAALRLHPATSAFLAGPWIPASETARTSHELELCGDAIALSLEDDAPLDGPRATFLADIMNPCWIFRAAPLDGVGAIEASVGQVPFNFRIGEDVKKIVFARPETPEGELEVRLDGCDGALLARLPLAPAAKSDAVTTLPAVAIAPREGKHDLCMRFAQRTLEPLWMLNTIRLVARP
jgi:hexosaminidase